MDLLKIMEEQIKLNNNNERFNKDEFIYLVNYCCKTARLLLDNVLNKSYYPLMTDDQIEFIKSRNIAWVVLNVFNPYFKDNTFIRSTQRQLLKEIENFECEFCLLYLRDENSTYYNMLIYLYQTFINII